MTKINESAIDILEKKGYHFSGDRNHSEIPNTSVCRDFRHTEQKTATVTVCKFCTH